MKIHVVYDSKAEAYRFPSFVETTGDGIRQWEEAVNDDKTSLSRHPGDFTLFEVADWNQQTGTLSVYDTKKNLGTALEYKKQPSEQIQMFKKEA